MPARRTGKRPLSLHSGLAEATRLLGRQYHLVITNVPYLARGKQNERLRKFAEMIYPMAKNDLANFFLERCLEFSSPNGAGVTQIVMPQNWLFLTTYKSQREHLLNETQWKLLVRLGEGGFDSTQAAGAFIILLTLTRTRPQTEDQLHGIDASEPRTVVGKAGVLRGGAVVAVSQKGQLGNPDSVISLEIITSGPRLSTYAFSYKGLGTGDDSRFKKTFWEVCNSTNTGWIPMASAPLVTSSACGGCSDVLHWEGGKGSLVNSSSAYLRNIDKWSLRGVLFGMMRETPCVPYTGGPWDTSSCVVIPSQEQYLPALWAYSESSEFRTEIRSLVSKVSVEVAHFTQVPFNLEYWVKAAAARYPNGLPEPYSDDPTQWFFCGHPCGSVVWDDERKWTAAGPLRTDATVLQVAVARLLGYRWPAENDPEIELADEARAWVEKAKALHSFEDNDGIVCVCSVRGERPGYERLLQVLQTAWGNEWRDVILAKLLAYVGSTTLDDWLRNQFFDEHCKLFHHRPFIWHVWDGRKRDGFHALVNYHKLAEGDGNGRRLLESLTYSYLGDWIGRQQDGVKRGEGGAEDRLAAALELQKRLVAILEGEPPFDIFVRWKSNDEQPIGWDPDINDGVRLNIRPFMAQDIPGGKKGAGILRAKPNIQWKKDRGKEPVRDQAQYPWFWENGKFTGERVNDVHLTLAEKRAARETAGAHGGKSGSAK